MDAPEAKQVRALSKVAGYVFPRESLMGRMIKLFQEQGARAERIGVEKDFILLRDYEVFREHNLGNSLPGGIGYGVGLR